jgi:hypothetical protein
VSHYASIVQKKAMAYAQAAFGTRFKTYRNTPMLQVQPTDLPLLGVYILRERRSPNSHANHAEPRFHHDMTLGFSGAIHAETAEQNQLYKLEEWMSELDDVLLSNPKFVILTEGIEAMDRQSQYAKVGETTLYEIRVEMTLRFSSNYPPGVIDDFNMLHVETQFPDREHAEAGTPQIIRVYDLPQNS